MANRYWVGGSNIWNSSANTKWASTSGGAGGQTVPTATDNVFFNAASGAATVNLGYIAVCQTINCTGFTGTINQLAGGVNCHGNVTLASTMTLNQNASAGAFLRIRASSTINTSGQFIINLYSEALAAGTVTLASAISCNNIIIANGTFNANTRNVTCNVFMANSSTAKTITMGTGTWTVNDTFTANTSNMTMNPNTSTIVFPNMTLGATPTIQLYEGSTSFNNVVIDAPVSGTQTFLANGSLTVNNMTIGPNISAMVFAGLGPNVTFTFTGNLIVNTQTSTYTLLMRGDRGTAATDTSEMIISKASGSMDLANVIITGIAFTGGATFTATNSFATLSTTGITVTGPTPPPGVAALTGGSVVR